MVNLLDTATLEDLTSPEGVAQFELFFSSLSDRVVKQVKAIHILVRPGLFTAVDLGLGASDLETLRQACETALGALDPDAICPAQSKDAWWEYWTAPLIGLKRVKMDTYKGYAFLIQRGTR